METVHSCFHFPVKYIHCFEIAARDVLRAILNYATEALRISCPGTAPLLPAFPKQTGENTLNAGTDVLLRGLGPSDYD